MHVCAAARAVAIAGGSAFTARSRIGRFHVPVQPFATFQGGGEVPGAMCMDKQQQRRGGWILKGAIAIAIMLIVSGCAPASSLAYNRHLRMAHAPQHVDVESYAAAQRIYGEPQAGSVLAGALSDDLNDHH